MHTGTVAQLCVAVSHNVKLATACANFFKVYDQMRLRLKANPVPIVSPIGAEKNFTCVVYLDKMKAINEAWIAAEGKDQRVTEPLHDA